MKANNFIQKKFFVPLLIFINSLVMIISALFAVGKMNGLILVLIGMITFYLVYSVPVNKTLLHDVFLVLAILCQGALSSILLLSLCQFLSKPVCVSPSYRTQVLMNFALPFFVILILWFTERTPVLFAQKRSKKR